MKVLFVISILCVLSLVACNEKAHQLDVKKEQAEAKTEDWQISQNYSVFSSADAKTNEACQVLNKKVEALVSGLQDSLKATATKLFDGMEKSNVSRPAWNCSLVVTDSIFVATSKYISTRLTVYTFEGGAHGRTDFYAFNYDVKNQKMLSVSDIIEQTKADSLNLLLKSHFKNPDNCFTEVPTLDQAATLNFSQADVCFTYAQYKLGPYVCGAPELVVPLKELKGIFLLSLKD